jgi:MFS transporter, ACS family, glucarate transporter
MPKPQVPTRTRHWVVVFAVTLAILSYIDRVSISKAAPYIMHDLGLTKTQMGRVFSAFALSYAMAEIPGGWLGDYMGPRKVLMRIVIWWSVFTASVTAMWSATSLWINQFLFGAGEAGCFPNLTKAFTTWLPSKERVRAQGIMWMSARWGGAFTPLLCALIFTVLPWRAAFLIFACLGVIWAIFFWRWFRDDPKDHKGVNAAELELLAENRGLTGSHGNVPWRKMISNRSVLLLWAQYFLLTYPWYFYITWLSTYLREYRGITNEITSARYAILPLLFGGIGCVLSGFLLPRFSTLVGSTKLARRITGTFGFIGAGLFMLLCIQMKDPVYGILAMGMASFCNDLVMPCAWGSCMDIGGKYAGTLSGSMNMMGNFAGFVAPQVGGIILDQTRGPLFPQGDYNMFLYTMAGAYFLGALCWPFIDPTHAIERADEAPAHS